MQVLEDEALRESLCCCLQDRCLLLRSCENPGLDGVNLLLAWYKIAATALATFNESLIDNARAPVLAARAKTPRRDLDRLAILLIEDHRHIVIGALDMGDGHRRCSSAWCPGTLGWC